MAARESVPVVTDATLASPEELVEAAGFFFSLPRSMTFSRTSGGVNNAVYYADPPGTPEGAHAFVLRVYRNGNNTPRVVYEHAVLAALGERAASLSFSVPEPLPVLTARVKDAGPHAHAHAHALEHGRGRAAHAPTTFALLRSGAACCVFKCIPGGAAPLSAAGNIGRATAELLGALAHVTLDKEARAVNPQYRRMCV